MRRLKRIFCLLLATMMFAGLLAGCESGDKETDRQEQVYDENNVGEIYYQEVDPDHVAESDEGIQYADNEILVVAKNGVSKSDIEKLSEKYNAEIVGYIEQTGDYQLKLSEAMSMDELDFVIEKIKQEEYIDSACVNYISEYSDSTVHEFMYGEKWENDLDNFNDCKGKSWGFEAIETPAAWDLLKLNESKVNPIKLGLIDSGFDTSHEDLKFEEVFYNYELSDHGTHVAGTMAAKANNSEGICGVYPYGDGNLYGASWRGSKKYTENCNSVMTEKCILSELLLRNVKVVNCSYGLGNYACWYDNASEQDNIVKSSEILADFLKRVYEKGYDFVIVVAAGNDSNDIVINLEYNYSTNEYVKNEKKKTIAYDSNGQPTVVLQDNKGNYYYRETDDQGNNIDYKITGITDSENQVFIANKDISGGHLESRYTSYFSAIPNSSEYKDIYNRIIVVGAVNSSFEISDFSNTGNRVDVFAPGENIYSTTPGNEYQNSGWSGTSMAAPHVSGVAAMVWSANNNLNGAEVKNIICNSKNLRCTSCNMVDAYIALEKAFSTDSDDSQTTSENGAILSWVVTNSDEAISGATITAISESTNEEYAAATDSNGHFELIAPAGTYSLIITADGYSDYELEKVSVSNGEVNYIDWIKMSPALTSFSVPDSMVMTIGELGVIEPDAEPSDANGHSFKWTTSDDSIVQIASDRGEICILTAKGKGTATVAAEATINGKTVSHSTEVRVASQARDTVLVLDVSGSMGGEPIEEMKKAAIKFCEELLVDEYNNRVGLVLYDNDIETYDLTNDVTALESYINGIVDGGLTNMEGGISCAIEMLDSLSTDDSIKNIVIMADGLPNEGNTSDSGSMAVSSSYSFYSTDISYANAVIDTAQSAMSKYNLYSLGFFHDLYGEEKDFAAALMQSLTNMNDGYHEVDQAENLQFAFGDISEEISDGSKIVINIACPVEVSISYQGETLSSSQSNYNDKTSFGSLQLLGKNQDVKVVSVDADKVYDIELKGTDEGAMDYSVNYFDDDENLVDSRSFTSIPITSTTNISSSTENSAEVSLNIDSDGDGISDIIYSAAQNSVGSVTWESEPETEPTTEPATEYTEPSTEVIGSSYNNGLETWQIILLVLGITAAVGIVIVAVVLVVTKEKTDDLFEFPIDSVISGSKSSNDNEIEALETKPLTSKSATISILSGSMKGKEFSISHEENVLIGKKPGITKILISTDYEKISRVHCTVSYSDKLNKFFVTDSSRNGTYYENHVRLVKGKRTPLVPGSIILLADDNCRILLK